MSFNSTKCLFCPFVVCVFCAPLRLRFLSPACSAPRMVSTSVETERSCQTRTITKPRHGRHLMSKQMYLDNFQLALKVTRN